MRLGCGRAACSRGNRARAPRGNGAGVGSARARTVAQGCGGATARPAQRMRAPRRGCRELGVPAVRIARAFRERHGVSVGEYGRRARIEWAAAQLVGATGRSPRSRPRQGSRIRATSRGCSGATSGRHPAGSGRSKAARRSRQGAAGVRSWGLRLEGGTMRARSALAITALLLALPATAAGEGASWRR